MPSGRRTSKKLRTSSHWLIVAVVAVGFVTNVGIGTMSAPASGTSPSYARAGAFGNDARLQDDGAARRGIWLIVMVLLIVLFARAFCGWICPVPLRAEVARLASG